MEPEVDVAEESGGVWIGYSRYTWKDTCKSRKTGFRRHSGTI